MPSKRQLQLKDARKKKKEKEATGAESAAAAPAALPAAAEKKRPVGRPRKNPGAEPSARRDPDRLCIDDAGVLLVGDSPHARPPAPRDFLEPEGRKSQQASRAGKQDFVFFNAMPFA